MLPFIFHVREVQTVHPGMKVVANMIKKAMYGN